MQTTWCEPKNVLLVHGEAAKMDFLRKNIEQEFGTGTGRRISFIFF